MPAIKTMDRITRKWVANAASGQGSYEDGIRNPRKDWATETKNAESNYEQGVTKAISRKAFGKGVSSAGTQKWQRNSLDKGPSRWATGISLAESEYQKGFGPFRDIIEKTSLPARGPKGDPKNIQRVSVMAAALHKGKLDRQGV